MYNVVGKLKAQGYHCEGLTSSDRHHPFHRERLDWDDIAQSYIITQQIFNENRQSVRTDIDFFVSDRSAFDFFCYYEYCIKENSYKNSIRIMVQEWIKTYNYIFVYKPLPFVDDGERPDNEFRMAVDKVIMEGVRDLYEKNYPIEIIEGEPDERDIKVIERIIEIEKQSDKC